MALPSKGPYTRPMGRTPLPAMSLVMGLVLGVWPGSVAGARRPRAARVAPTTTVAPPDAVEAALEQVPPSECRDRIRKELISGRQGDEGCEGTRAFATQALARIVPRAFGVVELRRIQLVRVQLVVAMATKCRAWPLRSRGRLIVRPHNVIRAGCRVERYRGQLRLFAVSQTGRQVDAGVLDTDDAGRGELKFTDVDATLREAGHGGLDEFARLTLGNGAWAGTIDLRRLRRLVADWHFEWVARGRGSAALFVARYPGHERAGVARALAVEATLARHERDYRAVARGEFAAERFLARYAWSPYRRSVMTLAGGELRPSGVDPAP